MICSAENIDCYRVSAQKTALSCSCISFETIIMIFLMDMDFNPQFDFLKGELAWK